MLDLLGLVCLEQEEGMETNTTRDISFLTVGQGYTLNLYSHTLEWLKEAWEQGCSSRVEGVL